MEPAATPTGFMRHIEACNNLHSPAGLIPFRIIGEQVGWLQPDLARWLAYRPQHFHFDASGVSLGRATRHRAEDAALADAVKGLAKAGYLRVRDEPFDVRATPKARCWRGWTAAPFPPSASRRRGCT
ncbi:DUF4743 domain-containing protein [Pseudoroseomonas wenyumeiae]